MNSRGDERHRNVLLLRAAEDGRRRDLPSRTAAYAFQRDRDEAISMVVNRNKQSDTNQHNINPNAYIDICITIMNTNNKGDIHGRPHQLHNLPPRADHRRHPAPGHGLQRQLLQGAIIIIVCYMLRYARFHRYAIIIIAMVFLYMVHCYVVLSLSCYYVCYMCSAQGRTFK